MGVEPVACPGCDLLQRLPALAPGDKVRCLRCGHVLAKRHDDALNRCLALTLAAAVLLVIANLTPLMGLSAVGRSASTTIIGGAIEMWQHGEQLTAAIVAFCAVIAPIAFVASTLVILMAAHASPVPRWTSELLRWSHYLRVWSLHEVMMLGILVALVKIAELARVDAGVGIFTVGALTILFPAIVLNFDTADIWRRIEWLDPEPDQAVDARPEALP
jgi:paraquat-inducible protein A